MAQSSKRRARKRRNPAGAPHAAASQRRERTVEREAAAARLERRAGRHLRTEGERPPSPFGGVPVSEIAIFAGLVAIVLWLIRGGTPVLVAGLAACTIGVLEVTAREHLAGFRSHATLLAAIPAVTIGIAVTSAVGTRSDRAPLLLVTGGPVFAILFRLLRRRFLVARQARVTRPPAP